MSSTISQRTEPKISDRDTKTVRPQWGGYLDSVVS
jgi:hypothetical protein